MGRKHKSRKHDMFPSKRTKKMKMRRLIETEEERRKRREIRRIRRAQRRFMESPEQLEVQLALSTAGKSRIRDSRRFEARKRRLAVLLADTSNKKKYSKQINNSNTKITPKGRTMARLIIKNELLKRLLRKLQQLKAKKMAQDGQGLNDTDGEKMEVEITTKSKTELIVDIVMLKRCLKKLKQVQENEMSQNGPSPEEKNMNGEKMKVGVSPKINPKTGPVIDINILKQCLLTIRQLQGRKLSQDGLGPEEKKTNEKKVRVGITSKMKPNIGPIIDIVKFKDCLWKVRQALGEKLAQNAANVEEKNKNENMQVDVPSKPEPMVWPMIDIEMLKEVSLKDKQIHAEKLAQNTPNLEGKDKNGKMQVRSSKMKHNTGPVIDIEMLKECLLKVKQTTAEKLVHNALNLEEKNEKVVAGSSKVKSMIWPIIDIEMLKKGSLKTIAENLAQNAANLEEENKNEKMEVEETSKMKPKTGAIIDIEMLKESLLKVKQTLAENFAQNGRKTTFNLEEKNDKTEVKLTPTIKPKTGPIIDIKMLRECLLRLKQTNAKESTQDNPGPGDKKSNVDKMVVGIPPKINPDTDPNSEPKED